MSNEKIWQAYREYTEQASNLARRLAYSVAGLCWLLKPREGAYSASLRLALACVLACLLLDLIQFVQHPIRLRRWMRRQEVSRYKMTGSIEGEYELPASLDRATLVLWLAKTVAVTIASALALATLI